MESSSPELIKSQFSKAEEKLQAARSLLSGGFTDDAISRAYYAIFHAASAVLLAEGIHVEGHGGLATMFGMHLVKPGKIDRRYSRILGRLKDERENGDYDIFTTFEAADAEQAVEDAGVFLEEMKRYLREVHGVS